MRIQTIGPTSTCWTVRPVRSRVPGRPLIASKTASQARGATWTHSAIRACYHPPVNVHELLIEPVAHIAPARAIEGLSAEDAERHVPGVTHSVADLIAHLVFWQDWVVERCKGTPVPMIQSAAAGWPGVVPGAWPDLRENLLEGLARAAALGDSASRSTIRSLPRSSFRRSPSTRSATPWCTSPSTMLTALDR